MRKFSLASLVALSVAAMPANAAAWVVVRAPVYVAPRPVVVAPAPVYVAPAPVYVETTPVYVPPPAPPQPPPSAKLPIDTSMWTLPPGCFQLSVNGQTYFQCGPNWLKAFQSSQGTYYAVVPAPR